MSIPEKTIKEVLVGGKLVAEDVFEQASAKARSEDMGIIDYLISNQIISKENVGDVISKHYKIPYANLVTNVPSRDLVLELPEEKAKKYHAVLVQKTDNEYVVATDNPEQDDLEKELKDLFPNFEIKIHYALSEDVEEILKLYKTTLETRFMEILQGNQAVVPELIEEIFEDAFAYYASDIHFEPRGTYVIIRFRVDGVLHEVGRIPKGYYENILNRIKILAKLRIDEHASAQDGAIRYARNRKEVDLRVSIVPTVEGEKVELRVLSSHMRSFVFNELGFNEKENKIIIDAAKKPFGMILVTGPTGAGKTTTLYSIIKILNNPEINITTIEDPVEYKVLGINQIQVNPQTNLTFAEGLRSIVRQDPDVILVGEIRDTETAEIATNAALTGHLLLSTFHANDAATAVPRLLDMEVEPFILASVLDLVIAQRLVRRICEHCKTTASMSREELDALVPESNRYFADAPVTLSLGKGCQSCGNTGYLGRVGIFEFLKMSPELKELILKHPSSEEIWDLAVKQGSRSIFEDGIEKVKAGLTTLEELVRVAPPPEYYKKNSN